jgi:hypothetical protein
VGTASKVQGQETCLEYSNTKKPLDTVAFKILFLSSYILLPTLALLFETFLEATMHKLLQHNLQELLNIHCILQVTEIQMVLQLQKERKITPGVKSGQCS